MIPKQNVIRAEMHGYDVCRILLEPAWQLVIPYNIYSLEAGMPFVVPVVVQIIAGCVRLVAADKIDSITFLLKPLPDPGAPAAVLSDGIAEGHVS